MNKKLIILAIITLALIPSVLASDILIQFSGHVTNNLGDVQSGVVVEAIGGGNTQTATTDGQGYFSLLLAPTTPCGDTINVQFKVEGTIVGNYPVIACTTAPQEVNQFTITDKLLTPITVGYFRHRRTASGPDEQLIPGDWDFCYLAGWVGKDLGGGHERGCSVMQNQMNTYIWSTIPETSLNDINIGNVANQKTWKSRATWGRTGSGLHCSYNCIRFEKHT